MNKAPLRLLPYVLSIAALCLGMLYLQAYMRRSYEPAQPVPFNHDTHTLAEKANIPCLACHAGAEKSAHAGMPAATTCLDCHRHILARDERLLPLHAAADPDSPIYTGEPLRWVRVQPLPAHAHFHHAVHTQKYACERCHPTPGKDAPMLMRDCLECHREEKQPTDCSRCHH